jgi:hypothetical protein
MWTATLPARAFLAIFAVAGLGLSLIVAMAIWLLDPYGVSPFRLPIARPIMDINQRYMYPQIARSDAYDSVVFGTSTSRLLDPEQLNQAFGGRFANLAMNAATAWEQTELAKLYLRHQPAPKAFILGVDHVWCQGPGELQTITFRGFPLWMYDENPWNDLPELFSVKTLEITGRLAAYHLGLMPERIRRDGFEVFTPPEQTYDLARAQGHIWRGYPEKRIPAVNTPFVMTDEAARQLEFPALAWLETLLQQTKGTPLRIIAFMPVHIAAQPVPGTEAAARYAVCRDRIAALAKSHGVPVIDFAIASDVTSNDWNYWDPLHYRLPIAGRIIEGLKEAMVTGQDSPGGLYKLR